MTTLYDYYGNGARDAFEKLGMDVAQLRALEEQHKGVPTGDFNKTLMAALAKERTSGQGKQMVGLKDPSNIYAAQMRKLEVPKEIGNSAIQEIPGRHDTVNQNLAKPMRVNDSQIIGNPSLTQTYTGPPPLPPRRPIAPPPLPMRR